MESRETSKCIITTTPIYKLQCHRLSDVVFAYAETLIDDITMLNAALKIVDQNPLGSAAGYGSPSLLIELYTTQELGFETLKFNSVAAQMSRGKSEKTVAFAMSSATAIQNCNGCLFVYESEF
jgi:argininosuccinate lyase